LKKKGGVLMTQKKNRRFVYLKREYLLERRKKLGLTQYVLAERSGFDVIAYNQIENGKLGNLMNAPKLVGLAQALEIPLETLCEEEIVYLESLKSLNQKEEG